MSFDLNVPENNFLVLKFCEKAHFGRFAWNYAETVFPQNLHNKKLVDMVAYEHCIFWFWTKRNCTQSSQLLL